MDLFPIRVLLWGACLFLLAASAATDLRGRIIPNQFVILIAAVGLTFGLISWPGLMWVSLLISVILFLGLGTLTHFGFIGGGDAKLVATVTLLVPPDRIGLLLMEIAFAGGLLSAAYLSAYYALRQAPISQASAAKAAPATSAFGRFLGDERVRIIAGQSVPYALAILGGVTFHVVCEFYQCSFAMP